MKVQFVLPVLIFTVFQTIPVNCQTWKVSGLIQDEQGSTLAGVSMYIDGAFEMASDGEGRFSVELPAMPRDITLRYLGYFTQRKVLSGADFQQNEARLEFSLLSQSPLLQEVVISAKPLETIIQEDFNTDFYDFGFAGNHLLLLLREKKRYLLRLMDDDGDALSEIQLPAPCRILHKSCVGNFHVVGDQWAWEVAFRGNNIDTLPRYPQRNFLRFVAPCAQESAGRYYFAQHGLLNQSVRYVVFENGMEPRIAFDIHNDKGERAAELALDDFFNGKPFIARTAIRADGPESEFESLLMTEKSGQLSNVEGLLALSGYGCDQIYRISELENIRRDSVYAPMFRVNDTLILFDHPHDRMIRFGPKLDRTDIRFTSYHHQKGWGKLILQDEANNRFFACFFENKGLKLEELDAWTGTVSKTWGMELAPYIAEKFKIRNGLLYFLGQPDMNTPNKMLYKMNIFAGKPLKP